jgi:multiple sugar transport system permease protein
MSASTAGKTRGRLATAMVFLGPSLLGFLAFTIVPLVLSFILAFSNWDVRQHNMFKGERIEFVGWENFERLLTHPAFYQYLGNTLFFMLGIPVAIVGSLVAALLLTRDLPGPQALRRIHFIAAGVLVVALAVLSLAGFAPGGMALLIVVLFGSILVAGVLGRSTVYRTLFYAPHFTAGVATFLLWKKMYNPQTGPINTALAPVVSAIESLFQWLPPATGPGLAMVLLGLGLAVMALFHRRLGQSWRDAELSRGGVWALTVLALVPVLLGWWWLGGSWLASFWVLGSILSLSWWVLRVLGEKPFRIVSGGQGFIPLVLPLSGAITGAAIFIGLAMVAAKLPAMAATGQMEPPNWLADFHWAKPAIMIMAFWAAVGSNNMILYIAGLTNIPRELYEAAEIDGANPWNRFWHVTWPQLAPVTFFIVVMSVIGGLQGGFEMARAMTQGGPAGSTTTLSYFVYIEGFESGRLGYASAVVWVLFAMVMSMTLLNFKFGNRNVNE